MISIISPAKRLDFNTPIDFESSKSRFPKETEQLIANLRKKSEKDIASLMNLSDKLASLNLERYHNFETVHNDENAKPALFAFQGDVYQGMQASDFNQQDVEFAQHHLRILSGLYGLLRPLDLIQPYRLEMGTRLTMNGHSSLYSFWGSKISRLLAEDLKAQGDTVLLNLASQEYFKSVNLNESAMQIVDVEFKELKDGKYKIIAIFAKKARGMMAHYLIKNKINTLEHVQGFDYDGYLYNSDLSSDRKLVFTRG